MPRISQFTLSGALAFSAPSTWVGNVGIDSLSGVSNKITVGSSSLSRQSRFRSKYDIKSGRGIESGGNSATNRLGELRAGLGDGVGEERVQQEQAVRAVLSSFNVWQGAFFPKGVIMTLCCLDIALQTQ